MTLPTPLSIGSWHSARGKLLIVLFVIHCGLRLAGLFWNIERHSEDGQGPVPSYHVDEVQMVQGLHDEFRSFTTWSLHADGPFAANLVYLALKLAGEQPPARWHPSWGLMVGRTVSVMSDVLAFPVLLLLFDTMGLSFWASFVALAVFCFFPNHVYNAHFARSHTLANLLQLIIFWIGYLCLTDKSSSRRGPLFAALVFCSVLAGATRYPFLTLGLVPLVVGTVLVIRAFKEANTASGIGRFVGWSALGLVTGIGLGFGFAPIEILREGMAALSLVQPLEWTNYSGIAQNALRHMRSILSFAGGGAMAVFALLAPVGLLQESRSGKTRAIFCWTVAVWCLIYLALWAKIWIPWQRYSMPLGMGIIVLGTVGLDHALRWSLLRMGRFTRIAATVAFIAMLASPAYLSVLIAARFVNDSEHPLFRASRALAKEPTEGARAKVFVSSRWGWNSPLIDLAPASKYQTVFVDDMAAACRQAKPGDLIMNLVFWRLEGSCDGVPFRPFFSASNLGPSGYPYPRPNTWSPGSSVEDYHYLFEDVELLRFPGISH